MRFYSLLMIFMIPFAYGQGSSSLGTECKKDAFSCGECETELQNDLNKLINEITKGGLTQGDHWGDSKYKTKNPGSIGIAPGVTLENTLQKIITLFKKHNPFGENKLNFVVIGESESLQQTTIKNGKIYPRIMLKSPNSELMVTFNTDPKARGYKTIEIMRWNGKNGRYEFQELNFGEQGEKPHVDVTGTKCLECHKSPDPRPNWDTYRAWAGVVPSRDDMLEKHARKDEVDVFDTKSDLQPDAKAYLNFLDQIVAAKESTAKIKSRISLLDIPFDEKRQLANYVEKAGKTNFSPREQVKIIKQKVNEDGYYRIKHFPDSDEASEQEGISFNLDGKTAPWAGPSQFAFDQMLAQNMCKVATDLKRHKNFDKFKYALAHFIACSGEPDIFPDSFKKKVLKYYKDSKYRDLGDIDQSKLPNGRDVDFYELSRLVNQDTNESHKHANGYKFDRHGKFIKTFLMNVEKQPEVMASEKAKFYSEEVVTPVLDNFHAIDDVGGVKGVGEDSGDIISDIRLLLEPFDVKVSHWSLVHGKNSAYNSFSFSDQFSLLEDQPIWDEIREEAGGSCSDLEAKAIASLEAQAPQQSEANLSDKSDVDLSILCDSFYRAGPVFDSEKIADAGKILMAELKSEVKQSMSKCLGCHDNNGEVNFPGLRKFVKSDDEKEFLEFLNSNNDYFKQPMLDIFQIKLGLMPRPQSVMDYGEDMPPSDWKDNDLYGKDHGIPLTKVQEIRRKQLATYLTFAASRDNKDRLKAFCEKINNDSYIEDFILPVRSIVKPAKAE